LGNHQPVSAFGHGGIVHQEPGIAVSVVVAADPALHLKLRSALIAGFKTFHIGLLGDGVIGGAAADGNGVDGFGKVVRHAEGGAVRARPGAVVIDREAKALSRSQSDGQSGKIFELEIRVSAHRYPVGHHLHGAASVVGDGEKLLPGVIDKEILKDITGRADMKLGLAIVSRHKVVHLKAEGIIGHTLDGDIDIGVFAGRGESIDVVRPGSGGLHIGARAAGQVVCEV